MRFVALWLAGIVCVVFGVQQFGLTDLLLLDKSVVWSEPWRLVTSLFAHGSMAHLLSNIFALLLFGLLLEGFVGPKKVLLLFLGGGLIINLFSPYARSLGASGAIYALIGALTVLRPTMTIWWSGMPMPMVVAGALYFLQDIVGLFAPRGVAHLAHIAGLGVGCVVGFYWRKNVPDREKKTRRREPHDPHLDRQIDIWMDKHT